MKIITRVLVVVDETSGVRKAEQMSLLKITENLSTVSASQAQRSSPPSVSSPATPSAGPR